MNAQMMNFTNFTLVRGVVKVNKEFTKKLKAIPTIYPKALE
jgi:hypothetical protein